MFMHDTQRIIAEEAKTDVVGLWAVLWEVKQNSTHLAPEAAMSVTLDVIERLLSAGDIVAGQFVDQNDDTLFFERWNMSVAETIDRIEREWQRLGKEPSPGEIVWFVNAELLPVTTAKYPMGKGWQPRH